MAGCAQHAYHEGVGDADEVTRTILSLVTLLVLWACLHSACYWLPDSWPSWRRRAYCALPLVLIFGGSLAANLGFVHGVNAFVQALGPAALPAAQREGEALREARRQGSSKEFFSLNADHWPALARLGTTADLYSGSEPIAVEWTHMGRVSRYWTLAQDEPSRGPADTPIGRRVWHLCRWVWPLAVDVDCGYGIHRLRHRP